MAKTKVEEKEVIIMDTPLGNAIPYIIETMAKEDIPDAEMKAKQASIYLRQQVFNPNIKVWIAFGETQVEGVMLVSKIMNMNEVEANIDWVYVEGGNSKTGARLLDQAKAWARTQGIKKLWDIVRESKLNFYSKNGFEKISTNIVLEITPETTPEVPQKRTKPAANEENSTSEGKTTPDKNGSLKRKKRVVKKRRTRRLS